jgi:hypothetical protein
MKKLRAASDYFFKTISAPYKHAICVNSAAKTFKNIENVTGAGSATIAAEEPGKEPFGRGPDG